MAKTIPLDKIISSLDQLEIIDLISVQRAATELISRHEKDAQELIDKANETIELIRTAGKE